MNMTGTATGKRRQGVEICRIVWWRGYVTGRFQAVTGDSSSPQVIAQSPQIRWRSSSPPGPTEAAAQAVESLKSSLLEAGWTVANRDDESWFGCAFSRPTFDRNVAEPVSFADSGNDRDSNVHGEPRIDTALIVQLRSELDEARRETERHGHRRLQTEIRAAPTPETTSADTEASRRLLLVLLYVAVIVGAAAICFLVFQSTYAALVAALTTLALAVAADGWRIANRHTS
jgi:hypothetical protein